MKNFQMATPLYVEFITSSKANNKAHINGFLNTFNGEIGAAGNRKLDLKARNLQGSNRYIPGRRDGKAICI